ncbi:MAG: chemotaxis protein CheW [Gammaproteobacteria bacterium]|nr:chemotaxis protein CheW [Gammaproteobacteria bacterium]
MQPKRVLHQYLADLMGEPDGGDPIKARVSAQTPSADPTIAAASCEKQFQATIGIKHAAEDLPAAGRTADEFIAEQDPLAAAASSGMPGWAEAPFQILMFRVCDVNLAVPLNELDGIARWNGKSTPIPGQPDWQLGLFLHQQKKISLVDLTSLIMPERAATENEEKASYLLLVGGARWGLLCNSIQRPGLVRADNIRWSQSWGKRRWSHGIIIENLTVLLNIDALLMMLGPRK